MIGTALVVGWIRLFRVVFILAMLGAFTGCSDSDIVPSNEAGVLRISDLSDLNQSRVVEIDDKQTIQRIRLSINQTKPRIAKFRTHFHLEFVNGASKTSVGVNARCVIKEGITFCGDLDIEGSIMEAIKQ